ncbi:MAG: crotonase/enoyl-CoA hydratase family protein [Microscillaceae bacterium]
MNKKRTDMKVITEKRDFVTLVRINRPEVRNAVDGETAQLLADAFRAFEADNEARVAVFGGTGGTFCAGADLKALAQSEDRQTMPMRMEAYGDAPEGVSRMLLTKPVIAAIDGFSVAGGMELALWCDLRVMEEDAQFGIFCRRWGVPLVDGGTIRLPRLIGLSRALDLILTGRPVAGPEAFQMGLANRLVGPGQAWAEALQLAEALARFPQNCLRNDRLSAYEQFGMDLDAALRNEFYKGYQTLMSQETLAGAKRFASGKGRGGNFNDI